MNKRRNTFKYSVAVAGLFGIISFCNAAQAVDVPASKAGMMRITMQHPGKAEMPAAVFDHEMHAAKVEKDGGDCAVCHTALGKDVKGMKPFSVVKNYKGKESQYMMILRMQKAQQLQGAFMEELSAQCQLDPSITAER